ncbi:WDR81 protein [Thecamonas trahens ATCC 50062]|uniref:WDR81 protein n=1 Tax=Thecamonas trahens ATCC 50062 TaxID=461836 RepID=A0A0L0DDI1_THETB|nr:WDR81 protein [Thecamonas trahens ATCC 50062]KNC49378.1 WDR81 protein [Thecamonas trahens ATCC 50062]|eukprot:XP_013757803.1 WDR81 protein [Thecamonas trahens ATCC 50062]
MTGTCVANAAASAKSSNRGHIPRRSLLANSCSSPWSLSVGDAVSGGNGSEHEGSISLDAYLASLGGPWSSIAGADVESEAAAAGTGLIVEGGVEAALDAVYAQRDGERWLKPVHPTLPREVTLENGVVQVAREPWDLTRVLAHATLHPLSLNQRLFVAYQAVQGLAAVHARGVVHGGLAPQALRFSPALLLTMDPPSGGAVLRAAAAAAAVLRAPAGTSSLTAAWVAGGVSNFEYLMALNAAVGRTVGEPHFHAILPWITDFSGASASDPGALRDLSKSKYRLKKGDAQLDMMYSAASPPHHITHALSDITFFAYMARVTPVEVLTSVVRSKWEPNEYPSSLERLYVWSPDEAIPQFFTDPSIFDSIHPDMPSLALPSWAPTAEAFIAAHAALLESPAVSAELHNWIDLTFGYKLSGEHAVQAKNVPLSTSSMGLGSALGFVKLFDAPHPRKHVRSTGRALPPNAAYAVPSAELDASVGDCKALDTLLQTQDSFDSMASAGEMQSPTAGSVSGARLHGSRSAPSIGIAASGVGGGSSRRLVSPTAATAPGGGASSSSTSTGLMSALRRLTEPIERLRGRVTNPSSPAASSGLPVLDPAPRSGTPVGGPVQGGSPNSGKSTGSPGGGGAGIGPGSGPVVSDGGGGATGSDSGPGGSGLALAVEARRRSSSVTSSATPSSSTGVGPFFTPAPIQVERTAALDALTYALDAHETCGEFEALAQRWLEPFVASGESRSQAGDCVALAGVLEPLLLAMQDGVGVGEQLLSAIRGAQSGLAAAALTAGLFPAALREAFEAVAAVREARASGHDPLSVLEALLDGAAYMSKLDMLELVLPVSLPVEDASKASVDAARIVLALVRHLGPQLSGRMLKSRVVALYGQLSEAASEPQYAALLLDAEYVRSVMVAFGGAFVVTEILPAVIELVVDGSLEFVSLLALQLEKLLVEVFLPVVGLKFVVMPLVVAVARGASEAVTELAIRCVASVGEPALSHHVIPFVMYHLSRAVGRGDRAPVSGVIGLLRLVGAFLDELDSEVVLNTLVVPSTALFDFLLHPPMDSEEVFRLAAGLCMRVAEVIGPDAVRAHAIDRFALYLADYDDFYESMEAEPLWRHAGGGEASDLHTPEFACLVYHTLCRLVGQVTMRREIENAELIEALMYTHLSSGAAELKANELVASGVGPGVVPTMRRRALDSESPVAVWAGAMPPLRGTGVAEWRKHWEPEDRPVGVLEGHSDRVRAVAVSGDERILVSASRDGSASVWRLDGTERSAVYSRHSEALHDVVLLPFAGHAVSCDSQLHVWDVETGATVASYEGTSPMLSLAHVGHASLVLGGTLESTIRFFDVRTPRALHEWHAMPASASAGAATYVRTLVASEPACAVLAGLSTGHVSTLDLRAGNFVQAWRAHSSQVLDMKLLSLDSGPQVLVTSSSDHSVAVWNALGHGAPRLLSRGHGHRDPVASLAYHGRQLFGVGGSLLSVANLLHDGALESSEMRMLRMQCVRTKDALSVVRVLPLSRMFVFGFENGALRVSG